MSSSSPVRDEAKQRALRLVRRLLRYRPRSIAEVRAYLTSRGLTRELRDEVIADSRRRGWLDDQAVAKLLTTGLADRGYGSERIRRRLLEAGLDERLIKDSGDDEARARAVAAEFLSRGRLSREQAHARLARRLSSRGFQADLIERVLTETLGPPPDPGIK